MRTEEARRQRQAEQAERHRQSAKKQVAAAAQAAAEDAEAALAAMDGTMRWFYGKASKVYTGKELLDIKLDNGELLKATPTFDIDDV